MQNIDTKLFQKLIKDANIDIFYSVEKFNLHKNVLINTYTSKYGRRKISVSASISNKMRVTEREGRKESFILIADFVE